MSERSRVFWLLPLVLMLVASLSSATAASGGDENVTIARANHPNAQRSPRAFEQLPLAFAPNAGQAARTVRYLAQGAGYRFAFAPGKATLGLLENHRGLNLD